MEQLNKPEEKFVTIQYDLWNSKYKPMEERNERLERDLKTEKENKRITIHMRYDEYGTSRIAEIGYIDIISSYINSTSPLTHLAYEDRWNEEKIINALNRTVRSFPYYIGKAKAEEMYKNMKEEVKKKEDLIKLNQERISKIPRIIRWLFKIKV